MTRRVLLLEPDATSRALVTRALTTAGYAPEAYASSREAEAQIEQGAYELCLVDELAGGGAALDEARRLRARYPRLPLVVTGTMLTAPVLRALLRLGVRDALPKPFTPDELRDAASHAVATSAPWRERSLDHAAAVHAAREALAEGRLDAAGRALARAWSAAPMDPEVMTLEALRAELDGRDHDALRGYRAALALEPDLAFEPPSPHEALARLAMYGAARPVASLDPRWRTAPLRLVADVREVAPARGGVAVLALSIAASPGRAHLREGPDGAFVLLPCDPRAERVAPMLAALGLDVARAVLDASADAAYPAPGEERDEA